MICAATACGRIGPVPPGSILERGRLEEMRMRTDASLMGAGTLRVGNPEMRGHDGEVLKNRIRAIITGSGDIPIDGKMIFEPGSGSAPVIFTGMAKMEVLNARLDGRAQVLGINDGPFGLSIRDAIDRLTKLNAKSVLIEGGSMLNYSALYEGVVDELYLTITPRLLGEKGMPGLADGPVPLGWPFLDMELIECRAARTGEVFLSYRIRRLEHDPDANG